MLQQINLDSVKDLVTSTHELIITLRAAEKECITEVSRCDKITIDLLHALEFTEDQNKRRRIATLLHATRRERRIAKDNLQIIYAANSLWSNDAVRTVLQSTRDKLNLLNLDGRSYKPKMMTEEEWENV